MKIKLILFLATLAIVVQSCATAPAPTATATRVPPPTVAPSPTPGPLCGTADVPAALADAVATATGLEKFEPPDGYAYFGFVFRLWGDGMSIADGQAWGDTRPFTERMCDAVEFELSGKIPTITKIQRPWREADGSFTPFSEMVDQIDQLRATLGPTAMTYMEWSPGGRVDPVTEIEVPDFTSKEVAAGQFDDYIREYAQDIRAYGQPLILKVWCAEFNGSWAAACSPKANPDLTTADFVNAYKRIVDIFNDVGVTNVAYLWEPVASPPEGEDANFASPGVFDNNDPDWQAYYPGDEYVDWIGVAVNDWGEPHWMDAVYEFAIQHDKPVFADIGMRHGGVTLTHAEQLTWMGDLFDYLESHPQIKWLCFFNYKNYPDPTLATGLWPDGYPVWPLQYPLERVELYGGQVNYIANVNDYDQRLIAMGEDMRALFASRIANPRYISTLVVAP